MQARIVASGLAGLVAAVAPPCLAQSKTPPAAAEAGTLQQRQTLMRQINQQQQSLLEQRSRCINRAATLQELERCERGYPMMGPGWRHGRGMDGWGCRMW